MTSTQGNDTATMSNSTFIPVGNSSPSEPTPSVAVPYPQNAMMNNHNHNHNNHVAHHIAEFGEVEKLHHIPGRPSHDDVLPAPHITHRDKCSKRDRMIRLRRRCFHDRHIHQYWHKDILFRTEGNRSITPDELFLDLVIVGGLAALGHELRETFDGWKQIEIFFLLFGAIYTSWRNLVLLWNIWGVNSDFIDKLGIYLVFTSLTFIALGSHGPFSSGALPYIATASFVASATPCLSNLAFALREPLLKDGGGKSIFVQCFAFFISSLPYLAAAFVTIGRPNLENDIVARVLFWIALGLNALIAHSVGYYTRAIIMHFQKPDVVVTRLAIAIELMVEKYDVLTMIVLGESVLSILFEGGKLLIDKQTHKPSLFGAAAASTALLYSLQTLYNNIDSPIAKGGKHAIRYKKLNGLSWSQLHIPYHAALVLFATGLGIALREVAQGSTHKESVKDVVIMSLNAVHATEGGESALPKFDTKARWLFSAGWGVSVLLSGLIGTMHFAGPRAATKHWRYFVRCLIAIPLSIGMPFSHVSAGVYLGTYTAVTVVIAIVEYLFVQMDRMGFFRSEATVFSSSTDGEIKESLFDDDDQDRDSSDDIGDAHGLDIDNDKDPVTGAEIAEGDLLQSDELPQSDMPAVSEALMNRLQRKHKSRLVRVPERKCMLERNASVF